MRRRVLVTGVGSGVGQGILMALRRRRIIFKIYVSDVSPHAAGLYLNKNAFVSGKLEDDSEFKNFLCLVRKNRIEIILPGNEYDLVTLARQKDVIKKQTGAVVVCSDPQTIELTNDKWLTYKFCLKYEIPTPKTFLINNSQILEEVHKTIDFPWVIKPRFGTASKGIVYVNDYSEAKIAVKSTENPLIQEFLKPKNSDFTSEFTCSIFKDASGLLHGPFIVERSLKGGSTWIAKIGDKKSLHEFLFRIAQSLEYSGPLNIQLIETTEGPKILELNCRFSGTTGIRSYFGFNEPEMAIKSFLQGKVIRRIKIREGVVLRYIADIVLKNRQIKN
jgi:carbamoyl-phosphate synthase large subunit